MSIIKFIGVISLIIITYALVVTFGGVAVAVLLPVILGIITTSVIITVIKFAIHTINRISNIATKVLKK